MKLLLAAATIVMLLSCGGSNSATTNTSSSYLFGMKFDTGKQQEFIAITSDIAVIERLEQQLVLPVNHRNYFISGLIARGNGGHNQNWGWHFIADEWQLVENSIELCDGNPTLVNQAVDYWVDTVGRFCPWGSYVIEKIR